MNHEKDPLTSDLDDDFAFNSQQRRIKILETRLDQMDNRDERRGVRTLAKAQAASLRHSTPGGLLERAQHILTDPTQLGVVEGHVNGGQLAKAAQIVERAERQADENEEDAAHARVEGQLKTHETLASISELTEKVTSFESTLNTLQVRLSRLERSQTPPRPGPWPDGC